MAALPLCDLFSFQKFASGATFFGQNTIFLVFLERLQNQFGRPKKKRSTKFAKILLKIRNLPPRENPRSALTSVAIFLSTYVGCCNSCLVQPNRSVEPFFTMFFKLG